MSTVTAQILVGSRARGAEGIQPRWLVLLHEAQGHAWHLLRLQLSAADIASTPKIGLMNHGAPGLRTGLDAPPGILWRSSADGDLGGELALLLHLYAARTPEILSATHEMEWLGGRKVDLAGVDGHRDAQLGNALRVARATDGTLYLAATLMAGSRLIPEDLLELAGWELDVSQTVVARTWSRIDGGHLDVVDRRSTLLTSTPSPDAADWETMPTRAAAVARENAASAGSVSSAAGAASAAGAGPVADRTPRPPLFRAGRNAAQAAAHDDLPHHDDLRDELFGA